MNNEKNKNTDKDYRPSEGQQSNERWDDINLNSGNSQDEKTADNTKKKGMDARELDEQTNTSGYGSSQRTGLDNAAGSVGPLDSDLNELPSEKRRNR